MEESINPALSGFIQSRATTQLRQHDKFIFGRIFNSVYSSLNIHSILYTLFCTLKDNDEFYTPQQSTDVRIKLINRSVLHLLVRVVKKSLLDICKLYSLVILLGLHHLCLLDPPVIVKYGQRLYLVI